MAMNHSGGRALRGVSPNC